MKAIWTYLRQDLRRKWAGWLMLALVFGVGAGGSMAAMAGARRAASAYPRFMETHKASDVSTGGIEEDIDIGKALDAIEKLPQVEKSSRLRIVSGKAIIAGKTYVIPDFFAFAPVDAGLPTDQDVPKVLKGRLPRPLAADEAIAPFQTAERFGLHVGDSITIVLGDPFDSGGKQVPVRIVGIVAIPGLFQGVSGSAPGGLITTKGLIDRYPDDVVPPISGDFYFSVIRFRHGATDIHPFEAALAKTPYRHMDLQFTIANIADVQKAMHPYALALWLLGIIGAFIVFVIAGQLLARQIALGSGDYPVLRALGLGRGQLMVVGISRAFGVAVLSMPIALASAYLLSPLTPIGDARVAEPSPGFAFDGVVLGLGVAAVLIAVCALAVIPAWSGARSATGRVATLGFERPSFAATAAAGASASAPAVTGLRMALEPGRGQTSVPVRATLLSVGLAIAALSSTTVFAASVNHLIDSPSLSGFTYDALVISQADSDAQGRPQTLRAVRESSDLIAAYANGNIDNATAGGREVFLLGMEPSGPIRFAPITGRPPTDALHDGVPEIAVGPTTLKRAHWHIGQMVTFKVDVDQGPAINAAGDARALVVGTAAMPAIPFRQDEPGDGIVMTLAGYDVLKPDPISTPPCCFVRFKEGVDPLIARTELEAKGMQVFLRSSRADLNALSKVAQLPATMSYILGVTAAIVLAYALLTAISRRRRDLAILKVFGFVRGQVRRTVAWHASVLTFIAAAIGLPVGIALGRYAWGFLADQFGVVPSPAVPLLFLAALIPAAVLLANVIAVVPARAAALTKPALVLRAE